MSYDLSATAALISERMGLHFPQDRWPDLLRGLERAAKGLGADSAHNLISQLLAGQFSQREVQALATHLTIGETHFFRTPETFEMLQTWLLPELIAAQQNTTRKLRIWSAGCATGQEPYSLAILISRLLTKLGTWDVTILATDINPEAFATAQVAEYTQWSFRGTPSWVVNGYFTRTQEGRYRLDPAIRDMVTFRYLNLVDDLYPSPALGMSDFDLILCRNVIMYFSRETMTRVADKLRRSIREGGYLLTTPSEASRDIMRGLTPVVSGGEILYRKTSAQAQPNAAEPAKAARPARAARPAARPTAAARPAAAAEPAARKVGRPERAPGAPTLRLERRQFARGPAVGDQAGRAPAESEGAAQAQGPQGRTEPREAANKARLLANKGHLEQALAHCEAALEGDKLNPSLHYLKASILQELGRPEEAERALQSTLFLDGDFALARVMLGAIARGQSRSREAATHFRAALSVLERMPSDSVLPETDGLTAGEMAETVASLMRSERAG
jgi:chemotaxis protein methyltransferase CheR